MNYLAEINAFEQWLETNYLPSSAQLLWYKLMMLDNKAGWSEWVTVDNQRLMALIQLKREATFIDIRDKLIEAGLIEYRKGKKGFPNQYKILTFNLKVKSVVQTEVETVDIYKQNKTKQNKKKVSKKEKPKTYDDILSESGLSENIIKSLKDFIQMRTLIKKPMTNRALELCIGDLRKLSNDEETQIKIIEQSVKKNWQGLYPLKDNQTIGTNIESQNDLGDENDPNSWAYFMKKMKEKGEA